VGLCQLDKLPAMLEVRRKNALRYFDLFGDREDIAIQRPPGESSWFSLSFVLRGRLAGHRDALVHHLSKHGVETRPIVAGNFTRNPVIKHLRHSVAGPLDCADELHREGFLVGNHHWDIESQLVRLRELFEDFSSRI
jgi:CDP-6-deoxy-D-xylo-4-hexulose-3-dehydrase